jgi:membrane fusion protein, multidrug efflux system
LEDHTVRIRKLLLGTTAVCVTAAALLLAARELPEFFSGRAGAATSAPPMAMPVPVAKVVKKTIPVYFDYSARTEALQNVTLQARISGYLAQQVAPDGSDVKAGDVLYKIDPRDYQAALEQMKAQATRDVAALDYARANLDRGTELARTGYLAKDTFDQRSSTQRQAEAALSMDKAGIRMAELNLSYTEVCAPFSGRLGRHQASVGTLVSPGAGTALNSLVQLDPIYVAFNPSETDLVAIGKARAAGKVEVDILLPGENEVHHQGELTFLDNAVDRGTGTIVARATIKNADFSLLPGQYVRARVHVGEEPDALMVPQAALGSSQLGKYVYVVSKDDTVEQRLVSLGATDGDLVTVLKGVSEGDQVIAGNLQKIAPGVPVKPQLADAK